MLKFHNIMVKILSFMLEVSMALLVLDVLLGVVSRYIVGHQVRWTEELACLLLVWSSFFGIALAFNSRSHLGIDLIVNLMGDTPRKTAVMIAHIVPLWRLRSAAQGGFHHAEQNGRTSCLGCRTVSADPGLGFLHPVF